MAWSKDERLSEICVHEADGKLLHLLLLLTIDNKERYKTLLLIEDMSNSHNVDMSAVLHTCNNLLILTGSRMGKKTDSSYDNQSCTVNLSNYGICLYTVLTIRSAVINYQATSRT